MRKLTLHISGMTCGHCLKAVSQVLHSAPGVQVESVQMGRALVTYDEREVDPSALVNAIAEAGYQANVVPDRS
jgi:copper chaperone